MAYLTTNFRSKAAAKRALRASEKFGVWWPGLGAPPDPSTYTGSVPLEGPHYPEPHRWYGNATVENGVVTKIT